MSVEPIEEPATEASAKRGFPWLVLLPLVIFGGLAGLFYVQLTSGTDPAQIPSVMVGKKAPTFTAAPLAGLTRDGTAVPGLGSSDLTAPGLTGRVSVVNVFASWCVPCRQEHPLLMELAKDPRVRLVGLNYKDQPANARNLLVETGDPYAAVGTDPTGRIGIDWGVYGVPESFVVRPDGTIAYKFIGPLSEESLNAVLMPEVEKALGKATAK